MSLEQVLYTAHATATGGRDGRAVVPDSGLDLKLTTPKELGGGGGQGDSHLAQGADFFALLGASSNLRDW